MFVGRNEELSYLEEEWETPGFRMPIVYGRRRVGKTMLLERFSEGRKTLFFTAGNDEAENTAQLRRLMARTGIYSDAGNMTGLLDDIFAASERERFLFVIDEYPNLEYSAPEITSELQKIIDRHVSTSKLFLALCGSSISFMKDRVLSYGSPLFGRRTSQMCVSPFTVFESAKFFDGIGFQDLCEIYGLVGGTPRYLEQIDHTMPFAEILRRNFLRPESYLFGEAEFLFRQELPEPRLYKHLLAIVGGKARKGSEIVDRMSALGISREKSKKMLNVLVDIEILKEVNCVGNPAKSLYYIDDCYFRFWNTFIQKVETQVVTRNFRPAIAYIEEKYQEYMGQVFETICKQWLIKENISGNLPLDIAKIGKWWGMDNTAREQAEIDIVAGNYHGDMIFCECKWRNEKTDVAEVEKLVRRSSLVKEKKESWFYVFSRSGFTDACLDLVRDSSRFMLLDMETMDLGDKNVPQALVVKP